MDRFGTDCRPILGRVWVLRGARSERSERSAFVLLTYYLLTTYIVHFGPSLDRFGTDCGPILGVEFGYCGGTERAKRAECVRTAYLLLTYYLLITYLTCWEFACFLIHDWHSHGMHLVFYLLVPTLIQILPKLLTRCPYGASEASGVRSYYSLIIYLLCVYYLLTTYVLLITYLLLTCYLLIT